jgi:hypothetical protein
MGKEGERWQLVEAKRDDGSPTIFRIRELDPVHALSRIFVVELPYPVADGSKLPDAPSYRRFATFEEQWLDPACHQLGWMPVAVKIEDGSFFVYLYGGGDPVQLVERLSPFDGALGFFNEDDPTWDEYSALRELLDEAMTMKGPEPEDEAPVPQFSDEELLSSVEHTKTTTRSLAAQKPPKTKKKTKPKKPAKKQAAKKPAKPAKKKKPPAKAKKKSKR